MNRLLKLLLGFAVLISLIFIFQKIPVRENLGISFKDAHSEASIKFKGLKEARDFAVDVEGNYYIAFKNKIQVIEKNGKSYELFKNFDLNIVSLCCAEKKLYYASDTSVYCYDIATDKISECISGLPNMGDYKDSIVRLRGEILYVTVGAATNSGVAGSDNGWILTMPYFHDIPPYLITLKGTNFGQEKTGAFQSYKSKSMNGQIISGHFPGNASLIIYNTKTAVLENFAYGIRNVKGMDFTSEGRLFASVGGMENRGLRPIIGDSDYLYEIQKGLWYGWPDYSGGDPVNSPRFKGKNGSQVGFVLENHPDTNPPAPLYQCGATGEIGDVAVDSRGTLREKNTIFFYKGGSIFSFDKKGVLKEEFILPKKSTGCKMQFNDNQLLILDSTGNLYSIKNKNFN